MRANARGGRGRPVEGTVRPRPVCAGAASACDLPLVRPPGSSRGVSSLREGPEGTATVRTQIATQRRWIPGGTTVTRPPGGPTPHAANRVDCTHEEASDFLADADTPFRTERRFDADGRLMFLGVDTANDGSFQIETTTTRDEGGCPIRTEQTLNFGTATTNVETAECDANANPTYVEVDAGGDGTVDAVRRIATTYDAQGRVLTRETDEGDDGTVEFTLTNVWSGDVLASRSEASGVAVSETVFTVEGGLQVAYEDRLDGAAIARGTLLAHDAAKRPTQDRRDTDLDGTEDLGLTSEWFPFVEPSLLVSSVLDLGLDDVPDQTVTGTLTCP